MAQVKTETKTVKNNGGRPRKPMDYEQVEKLAEIMCTQEEIATLFGVHVSTLVKYPEFHEAYKKGIETGRKSLRRMQYDSATKGNVTMQIWLGKQYLGQKDRSEVQTNTTTEKLDSLLQQLHDTDEETQNNNEGGAEERD